MLSKYTPIRFDKGDSIIIDSVHYAIKERERYGLSLRTLADGIPANYTHDQIFEMYLEERVKIVRGTLIKAPEGVQQNLGRDMAMFSPEDQQIAMLRYEFVNIAIRFISRGLYPKRPKEGFAKCAKIAARYLRWRQAKEEGKEPNEIGIKRVGGSTLRDWYWRYVNSGCQLVALIPLHDRKGKKKVEPDGEVAQIISKWAHSHYLTAERPSLSETADLIKAECEARNKLRDRQLDVPSESMIRLWFNRNISKVEKDWYREGKNVFANKFRHVQKRTMPVRPLEEVQIDHQRADVSLFLDELEEGLDARIKKERELVTPWITLAVCVATRMVVGWYISITPPSWESVMACLRMAMMPKNPEQYGAKGTYPVVGVPERVRLDNGKEFHSGAFTQMLADAGISAEWCPRRKPESKPHIERLNGTVARQLMAKFSGRRFSSVHERGDYDSEGRTRHMLSEFKREFGFWIVDIYHNTAHAGLGGLSPLEAWKDRSEFGTRAVSTYRHLKAISSTSIKCAITNEGIKHKHLVYQSAALQELRRRVRDKGQKYVVKIDPIDVSKCLVLDADKAKWIDVPCVDQVNTMNLTMAEHKEQVRTKRAINKRRMENPEKGARAAKLEQENRLAPKRIKEAKLKQQAMRDLDPQPTPMFDVGPSNGPTVSNPVEKERRRRHDEFRDAEWQRVSSQPQPVPSPNDFAAGSNGSDPISAETMTLGVNDYD